METDLRTCLNCGKPLKGRIDKKFCDDYCRNSYNNQQNSDAVNLIRNINNILRKNRRILQQLIPEQENKKVYQKTKLIREGYDFRYHTHQLTTQKGTYLFCYDHGVLELEGDSVLLVRQKV